MSIFDNNPHWTETNCATLAKRLDGARIYPNASAEEDPLHFAVSLEFAQGFGFSTPRASARLEARTLLEALAEVDARFPVVDGRAQLLRKKQELEQAVSQHEFEVTQLKRSLGHEKDLLTSAQRECAEIDAKIAALDAKEAPDVR